jgi:predicted Zn-dependent peptidase
MLRKTMLIAATIGLGTGAVACRPDREPVDPGAGSAATDQDAAPPALVWPDEEFRYEAPEPGPIAELKLPELETFELANGIDVYLMRQQVLPTMYMSLQFDMGEISDPSSKIGMTSLCMDLIGEGTKSLDKVAFEEKQADHAVSVWSRGGTETSSVGLRALKKESSAGLDLVSEMMREPGLRQADLDRLRDRAKARLEQSRATPSSIARRLYGSLVYGAKHPYGRMETEKSLDAVTVADCRKVAAKLKPNGARLFVVGMTSPEELKKELDERWKWWKGKAPRPRKVGSPKPRKGQIVFVDAPKANQSQVWVGHPGPARTAKDYEATEVMAQILGGGFSSRINMNLREDKGFSYGGRGGFRYARNGSYFVASSAVRADSTAASLREIAAEIGTMRSSEPSEEEMQREIEGRLLALPAQFGSATRSSFAFQSLVFYGLDLDWYAQYQERLKALDPAAVQQAARDHLQDGDFTVLVVGDASVVLDDLRQLADEKVFGSGGLVVVDADGQRVSDEAD